MPVTLLEEAPRDLHRRQCRSIALRRDARHHPLQPARRRRLLAALGGPGARPFAALVAPAGFGKTVLLRDWCAQDPRPSAWLSLDRRHDDPLELLRAIAQATDEAYARDRGRGIVLVLDDVQNLHDPGARQALAGLVQRPSDGVTIAFASRAELPLPIARLHAEGLVTELRAPDLAMTRAEAAAFYRAAEIPFDAESLKALMHHTEGWPAALSLTRLDRCDRLVADYVRDEVLAPLDEEERAFATATAPLEVLAAPLCDAVLKRSGSAALLARLQRSGFPFVALDRGGERLRHHRLVRKALLAELARVAPERELVLHRRASEWHERAGDPEAAVGHALAAGDADRAGAIVWAAVPVCFERAASERLEHWLDRFAPYEIAARPRLALAAAGTELVQGHGDVAEHWLRVAASAGSPPVVTAGVVALRASLGRDGLAAMDDGAARAGALLAEDDPGQAFCRLTAGVAAHLRGDGDVARTTLEDGARRAAVPAPLVHSLCLAQLALLAVDDGEREEAAGLATRARAQVDRFRLGRFPSSALVFAVSALIRIQRGRVAEATEDLETAGALLGRLVDFAPWYMAEVELVIARAALRLSDVNQARERTADAARRVARIPGARTLADWVDAIEADIRDYREATQTHDLALTAAELKVLQFLPTHLTLRQVGELTCVTANTVKTQAGAIYRKLGVRSRSEAVTQARELGLIDA